jgi:RNA recognition motif-containing protein
LKLFSINNLKRLIKRRFTITKKIYFGNLPFSATEKKVQMLFEEYDEVESISIQSDRSIGKPRDFAFVEMISGPDEAIDTLNQYEFNGRTLNVNKARH